MEPLVMAIVPQRCPQFSPAQFLDELGCRFQSSYISQIACAGGRIFPGYLIEMAEATRSEETKAA
jgi:hypothetical protein